MSDTMRILVAAADPIELDRLRESFPQVESLWRVAFSSSFEEIPELVSRNRIDIIFVNAGLDPMDSVRLLDNVWNRRSETVRFLFGTAQTADLMVRCAMGAHHFLAAALEPAAIEEAIERARCMNRLLENRNLQSLVSQMRTLPSRPSVHFELMKELRSSSSNAEMVGELVSRDFAISTKLIQVVNSAYYGLARQVSDVSDAVLLLGLDTTSSIVLSIEAFARFDKVKPLYFSIEEVWRHSQTVAHAARKIAQAMTSDAGIAADAFTAGLLHDIGKLALALNFEDQYRGAMNLARKTNLPACEVETDVFGASHAEAGAYLLSLWGLPLRVIEAVANHHAPAAALEKQFTATTAVHLAERLQYEKELVATGVSNPILDLAYPQELGLGEQMDTFRAMFRGSDAPSGEGTQFFMRKSKEPEPATSTSARKKISYWNESWLKPSVLGFAATISVMLIIAPLLIRTSNTSQLDASAEIPPPAAPQLAEPPNFAEFRLQAIVFKGQNSYSIINGKSLRVGEEIEGATLTAVEPTYVVVAKAGNSRKLELR